MTAARPWRESGARRARILETAICMLGERGFNGLTIHALAERCEISNAGLLYYFASKDELFLAVLEEFEHREREELTFTLCKSLLGKFVPDPTSTCRHLVAAMQGLGQHWLRHDMDFNLVEEWRGLSALILAPHGKAAL